MQYYKSVDVIYEDMNFKAYAYIELISSPCALTMFFCILLSFRCPLSHIHPCLHVYWVSKNDFNMLPLSHFLNPQSSATSISSLSPVYRCPSPPLQTYQSTPPGPRVLVCPPPPAWRALCACGRGTGPVSSQRSDSPAPTSLGWRCSSRSGSPRELRKGRSGGNEEWEKRGQFKWQTGNLRKGFKIWIKWNGYN